MKPLTAFAAGTRTRGGEERFRRFQEPLVFRLLTVLFALALRPVRVELGF